MREVVLNGETDLAGWREAARALRLGGVPPDAVAWRVAAADELDLPPGAAPPPSRPGAVFTTPRRFVELAAEVVCHRSPGRFDLLYRLLRRLGDEPALLALETNPDVAQALAMARQVAKAAHKMKAFVRFRQVRAEPETYLAWFEPPHFVVERTAGFFQGRFANMRFAILTPDLCCRWDLERLTFGPGVARPEAATDDLEGLWLTYYASIFNPARLKVAAMRAEMPKRYWRNLPEAALIPDLVSHAETRTETMVEADPTRPARRRPAARPPHAVPAPEGERIETLAELSAAIQPCRRCDLWRDATRGVAGEGPPDAPLMLVGEQPGDLEDLEGRPFVGPAGQLLSRALEAAGIVRAEAYVTNAVKHFKHEPRGKRRLHKTPDAREVRACRWWLDRERALLRPRLVVALGGTAALAVFGKAMPIMKSRGRPLPLEDGSEGLITVHPSYLLRLPDETAKREAWRAFVDDLRLARERVSASGVA